MPAPIAQPLRERMSTLFHEGQSIPQIARLLQLNERTTRRILRQLTQPSESAEPAVERKPSIRVSAEKQTVWDWCQDHSDWGAPYLLVRLTELDSETDWPSVRTLQRWMAEVRTPEQRRTRRPHGRGPRSTIAHQTWQVDAVEQLPLATRKCISWFRVTDECSGAFLHSRVFSLRTFQPHRSDRDSTRISGLFCSLGTSGNGPSR